MRIEENAADQPLKNGGQGREPRRRDRRTEDTMSANWTAICESTLTDVARHLRSKAISPTELTKAMLERIARLDPSLDERYCTEGTDPEVTRTVLAAAPVFRDLGARLHTVSVTGIVAAADDW